MFGKPIGKSAAAILQERYHGRIEPKIGYVVMVFEVKIEGRGLVSSSGGTVHRVEFDALVFLPKLHEVVMGEIIEMADFGAFVRIGPTDAVLHLSQISGKHVKVDAKAGIISIVDQPEPLRIGTRLRSRISAVSVNKDSSMKVGLTCNEPDLGPDGSLGR